MAGVNKVIILGRLGSDPELRSTTNGTQVCTLSIATSETWMKEGQREEKTEWHRVVFFGRQAETIQRYLKKGSMLYLEGRLQTRSWDDAQTGQKRYTTEIIGNQFTFVGGRQDNMGAAPSSPDNFYDNQAKQQNFQAQQQPQNTMPTDTFGGQNSALADDDDVPF